MGGGLIADLMVRFGADIAPLERGMRDANRLMDQTASHSRDAAQRMQDFGARTEAAGRNLSAMGRTLSTRVTAPIAALGAGVIRTGISYNSLEQRARAAFTTLLGGADQANAMMDELMAFGSQSPFPRQLWIEASQQLIGFGMAGENVVGVLGSIQDSAAAVGATNDDIARMIDIFAQIQGQGRITGRELNRLGQLGIDAAQMLADSAGVARDEMRASISAGAVDAATAITALTEQMDERFGGAAQNIRKTWDGATDRIAGAWRDLSSAVLEPFVTKGGGGMAVEWANNIADLLRAAEAAMKNLSPEVVVLGAAFAGLLAAAGPVMWIVGQYVTLFGQAAAAVGRLAAAHGGLIPLLTGPVTLALVGVTAAIATMISSAVRAQQVSRELAGDMATLAAAGGTTEQALRALERAFSDLNAPTTLRDEFGLMLRQMTGFSSESALARDRAAALVGAIESLAEHSQDAAWELLQAAEAAGHIRIEADGAVVVLDRVGDAVALTADETRELVGQARSLEIALGDSTYAASLLTPGISGYTIAVGEAAESTEEAVEQVEQLTEQQKALQSMLEAFASPMTAYTGWLETLSEEEAKWMRDHTQRLLAGQQSWDDFVADVHMALDGYAEALEQQNRNMRNWQTNLVLVAQRAGADIAQTLADMGTEGVHLVAAMADGTDDEVRRMATALRENARVGSDDMVHELERGFEVAEAAARLGSKATAEAVAKELGVGLEEVARLAQAYNIELVGGINPILGALGRKLIPLNRPTGGITEFAGGGFLPDQARIQRPGTLVQWAEPETGGEAFIPLAASKRPRSVQIWEETGRRLGIDLEPTGDGPGLFFRDGGFRSLSEVPSVPSFDPYRVPISTAARAVSERARDEAMAWLQANLAPALGAGVGWRAMWEALSRQFPDARLHSALRPGAITATGNPSYHGMGRAIDVSPRMDIFNWIAENYPQSRELIFSPANRRQIRNGAPWMYSGVTRAMHWDHVHWAMADGGVVRRPGRFLVGEEGPEVVNLGRGDMVQPLDRDLIDYDRLAEAVARHAGLRDGDTLMLVVDGQPVRAVVRREIASHDRALAHEIGAR